MADEKPDLSIMAKNWPSAYVARQEVKNFTGGILTAKYCANLDCQGQGPKGRLRVGRKISYPVQEFISWLESRATIVKG